MNMPTTQQWDNAMRRDVPWKDAYGFVERNARALLELSPGAPGISTHALAELLYPEAEARGTVGVCSRQRIFKALAVLTVRGLSDCASRGTPRMMGGQGGIRKTIVPWLWHAPTSPNPEAKVKAPNMVRDRECFYVKWGRRDSKLGADDGEAILFSQLEQEQLIKVIDTLQDYCVTGAGTTSLYATLVKPVNDAAAEG